MKEIFDKKVQLQKPISVSIDGMDFKGSNVGIESIYVNSNAIQVGVQPHNVMSQFMNKFNFNSESFTEIELEQIINPFIDLIKSKISDVVESPENQEVANG
ncbi:MAG TPA: hypothetical protein VHO70_18925 [Chitinispirillaceae bacterium]|nr:hypothetical protein [Chitinispirillaceae bacterium]